MVTQMKDMNIGSSKRSIIQKYDKNGDGIYQTDEVNAIIDDYMATMKNNATLAETNRVQKKVILFCAAMILLLSISNVGTAFLAVTLAKEVKVSPDGSMTSTNGNDTPLMTMEKVENLTITGNAFADGRQEIGGNVVPFGCFYPEEVEKMYINSQEGSGTNVIVKDGNVQGMVRSRFIGGSALRTFSTRGEDPIRRRLHLDFEEDEDFQFEYTFPESKVKFVHAPELCGDNVANNNRRGRKLQYGPKYGGIPLY